MRLRLRERGEKLLEEKIVREARPEEKPYKLVDGRGLFLLVKPSGSKLWQFNYRFRGLSAETGVTKPIEKTISFGRYPDVDLAVARQRHDAARKLLAASTDPMAERKAQRVAAQVATESIFCRVAAKWLERWRSGKAEKYATEMQDWIEDYVLSRIGTWPISRVSAEDVRDIVRSVPAPTIAKRVYRMVRSIFAYGIAQGYGKHNPAAEIEIGMFVTTPKVRHMPRIELKELPKLLQAMEEHCGRPETKLAMLLMAHVFLRVSELLGGRWEEIDWTKRRWDVPAARMKMEIPHIVLLAEQTVELLYRLRELTGGGPWMFPANCNTRKNKTMSQSTILKALREMGYGPGIMCSHGFRGVFSTWAHEEGFDHAVIELQLSHAEGNEVSRAYNASTLLEPRRLLMQAWANHLEEARRGGKVVPISVA